MLSKARNDPSTRKFTPPTADSGAGLGTEGACPPLTPGAKPGRGDTLRLTPLLPAATTKGPVPGGDWGPLTSGTNFEGRMHTRSAVRKP
ncbi:hypothetical protein E2C01_100400 [Portunus trituberculatus]|uniref:Uncharacterized protein n=1 Tax=Portunus trituberculatus TaxID=210409 RepID=A0A5B7KDG6_PORTR|nr:hypothetical protein [Portunus trituberculatus]